MKFILETFFSILFFGIIIACLPTIIGFISLCCIIYFIYMAARSLFSDGTEQTTVNYDRKHQVSKQNEHAECQTKPNKQKTESETIKSQKSYSSYSYPHYRRSSYDSYDDYYDDWGDNDMPPEEGDGFRGTGVPFL